MALKTSVASGKSSATATWNTAKKVEAGDEVVITGFAVEWNSALAVASMEVTSTGTLSGSTELKVTGSLVWASAATITWKSVGGVVFSGTGAQSIALGGHSIEALKVSSSGKLKLVESVATASITTGFNTEGTATLELNGRALTGPGAVTFNASTTLDATGGGTITLAGAGSSTLSISTGATVVNGSLLTLEAESTGGGSTHKLKLGGKAVGTIVALAGLCEVEPGTGGSCVELKAMNKEAANEAGLRITKGQTLEVTGAITSNGEAGKLARIESSVAGERATIKHTGNLSMGNSFAVVKDIAYEGGGGTLYVQHGEGTNDAGVAFEAEPGVTVAGLGMVL